MSVLILGSVALDTIETEHGSALGCLGGSASHACLAASYFVRPQVVGIVGEDFPERYVEFLGSRADLSELQQAEGKTFSWHGVHSLAEGTTKTLRTDLNNYETFTPHLSPQTRKAKYVFLGNISPDLQLQVLEQLHEPRLVACDTMSLWISTAPEQVREVMRAADLFLLNETEAEELTGERDPGAAGRTMLEWGAKRVIVKRGPQPALLLTPDISFEVTSCNGVDVVDPTGAGDNFAGAMMGYVAAAEAGVNANGSRSDGLPVRELHTRLAEGMRYGAAAASYSIETFGTQVHKYLTMDHLEQRRQLTSVLSHAVAGSKAG